MSFEKPSFVAQAESGPGGIEEEEQMLSEKLRSFASKLSEGALSFTEGTLKKGPEVIAAGGAALTSLGLGSWYEAAQANNLAETVGSALSPERLSQLMDTITSFQDMGAVGVVAGLVALLAGMKMAEAKA